MKRTLPWMWLAGVLALTVVAVAESGEDARPDLVVPLPEARAADDEISDPEKPSTDEVSATPAGKQLLEQRRAAAEESPAEEEPTETEPDGFAPPPFPLSRYQQLWERPPFHLESVAPPVESEGLGQRYALTGIAEISGKPIAFLMERATQRRIMVEKDDGESDLSLVQVDLVQQKYEDSTVTIKQGAEVGVIRFDAGPAMPPQAMGMGDPRAQQMAGVRPPVPGAPGTPQAQMVPGQVQAIPGQIPQVAGVQPDAAGVPSIPGQAPLPNGQVQPAGDQPMPPPRVIRRRAIVPSAP